MKEKDRYKNNSQNNSYAILLQTSKSEADLIKRTLCEDFQLLKEAYDYAETLESPYKFMAIEKKINLKSIDSENYTEMFRTLVIFGIINSVCAISLTVIVFSISFLILPLYLSAILGFLIGIVITLVEIAHFFEIELNDFKREEHLTHDAVLFKNILNKLEKHVSKDTEKYKFKDRNIIFFRIIKNDYFIYDLFYRTKTFALESFLEADRMQDYDTQFSIIKPMVEDISDEILIAYKKHKQIEIEAAELQKQKLKEQVKYDLQAYENRVLKEKGD